MSLKWFIPRGCIRDFIHIAGIIGSIYIGMIYNDLFYLIAILFTIELFVIAYLENYYEETTGKRVENSFESI